MKVARNGKFKNEKILLRFSRKYACIIKVISVVGGFRSDNIKQMWRLFHWSKEVVSYKGKNDEQIIHYCSSMESNL